MPQHSTSPYLVAVALVLFGTLTNYLSIELVGDLKFIFTPAILFLTARILPLYLAIFSVSLVLLHLCWVWEQYFYSVLYFMEVIFYCWFSRKHLSPLSVDMLFWVAIGLPFTTLILSNSVGVEDGMFMMTLAKQPINGIVYTLVASLLLWIPHFNRMAQKISGAEELSSIRFFIRDFLLLLFVFPTLAVVIFIKTNIEKNQLERHQVEVANQVQQISIRITEFLNLYQTAITRYADNYFISQLSNSEAQRQIESMHQLYSGFITMLVADNKGIVQLASPPELYKENMSISSREYFQIPKKKGIGYMSEAFRGRGFGTDPIVAISAPLRNNQGEFHGIIEGSLDLYQFDLFSPSTVEQQLFLVLDKNQRVVFASSQLELTFLQKIEVSIDTHRKLGKLISFNSSTVSYLYSTETLDNQWQVISLQKKSDYLQKISNAYFWLSVNLLISLVIGSFVAGLISSVSSRPIDFLLKKFKSMSLTSNSDSVPNQDLLFHEFNQMIYEFDDAYRKLKESHDEQQKLVSDKLAAEKANESKSIFVSRVSHELRTPLNAILGNIQLIKMDQEDSKIQDEILDVERAGKHLLSIIEDLLQITKLDVGELKVEPVKTQINSVITDVMSLLRELAESKNVQVVADISVTELTWLWLDPVRIKQVLTNIINNAIKYNNVQGSVIIQTETHQDRCLISVIDTGIGIETQYYDGIFEPFQRLAQKHSHIEGSGLGLSLSSELILQMSGKLWYQSEKNQGTTFFIEFPLPLQEVDIDTIGAVSSSALEFVNLDIRGKQVLYVEDNKVNYMILEKWLKRQEVASVDNCATGADTQSYLTEQLPDLIFLDLGLPDIDGLELAKYIKSNDKLRSIPLFVLTAEASSVVEEQSMAVGCAGYLTKPVDFDEITKKLVDAGFYSDGQRTNV